MPTLIDREIVPGTTPTVYIGRRFKNGSKKPSKKWYAEYCMDSKQRYESLRTNIKEHAIRNAHLLMTRLQQDGPASPKRRIDLSDLVQKYIESQTNRGRAPIPFQDRLLEHESVTRNSGIKRDKHSKTSFFLKDVLRMKADGSPMSGQVADQMKNKGKMYRYYRPRGYGDARYVGTAHGSRVPAEPFEAFVIDVLAQVLERAPNFVTR